MCPISMPSDFYVIRKSGGLVEAVNFNVSKQGKAKEGLKEEWRFPRPAGTSGKETFDTARVLLLMDAKLQNIWVVNPVHNGGWKPGVFCLKAGGIDQEILDCQCELSKSPTKDWYFVRGTGDGESQLYILHSKGKENKVKEINFSESGYVMKEYPMRDLIPEHIGDPDLNAFKFISESGKSDMKFPDCRAQHPLLTTYFVGRFYDSRYDSRYSEGNIHIGWDFEDGFSIVAPPGDSADFSEEPIDLPGEAQYGWEVSNSFNETIRWKNSTQVSSFEDGIGCVVLGILPFGNNAPKPRFPRTKQEKDFEEDTKNRFRDLEGRIRELEGMFQTLRNRGD